MKMKKTAFVISILAGILVLSALVVLAWNSTVDSAAEVKFESASKSPDSHTPIYINGNAGFTAENGVSNPGAAGTENDPYIIENWDIDASGAIGIWIENTDAYFIIRNCVIHDGKSNSKDGLYFSNVTNGKIDNIISCNNRYGNRLYFSSNNNITSCAGYNNSRDGIYLYDSSNNTISNCNVYHDSYYGISLEHSSNNSITNCNVYNNSYGIMLGWYSSNNRVTNCIVYTNSHRGFHLYDFSNNNTISNCAVYNNSDDGIYLYDSSDNEVHYNNICNNINYGIDSFGCTVNATYNWWGSADGPYHPDTNPSGMGDNVTYNVIYEPWLTEPWAGESGLTPHAPISINDNSQFTFANGVASGNGTAGNPYIIENWDINASTANGIDIRNTNKYFIIRNCVIYDGTRHNFGVYFYNLTNGKIDTATFYDNSLGIYLGYSSNNTITNNTVYNNPTNEGIWLDHSPSNTISNCAVYNNYYGIRLFYSSNNQIVNCTVHNNSDDGIYLEDSQNIKLTKCYVYNNNDHGISLDYSSNDTITNCDVYNNSDEGITLWQSSNNQITNCDIYNNSGNGIYGDFSSNNQITNCNVYSNAIGIEYTLSNAITNSNVYNNYWGIYLSDTPNSTIINSNIYNNYYGITQWYLASNITNSNVYNNYYGIELWYSSNNKLHYINIYNNTNYGIYNHNAETQYQTNATYNWWGDASGPYHEVNNSAGLGDNVSNNVIYEPWLTEPNPEAGVQIYPDSDGDGLPDYRELELGSNPDNSDTDGDGKLDGVDPLPTVKISGVFIQKNLKVDVDLNNYGTKNVNINFVLPDDVKVNDDNFVLSPMGEDNDHVWVEFFLDVKSPTTKDIIVRDVANGLEETVTIGVDSTVSVIGTDFIVPLDGYSFRNNETDFEGYWEAGAKGYCFGVSETSILYFLEDLDRPHNAQNTYSLSIDDEVYCKIKQHQDRWESSYNWPPFIPENNYETLKNGINEGKPMILKLKSNDPQNPTYHAVVAYKIVEKDNIARIYICNPNNPYVFPTSASNFTNMFSEATYIISTGEFSYTGPDVYHKFKAVEATLLWQEAIENLFTQTNSVFAILSCPANLTITDQYNRQTGFVNGNFVNNIPNASIDIRGGIVIYILPRNLTYTYQVSGKGNGYYNFTLIIPEGEYIKTYDIVGGVTPLTIDTYTLREDTIELKTNENKNYSLMVTKSTNTTTQTFTLTNMSIESCQTHSYEVLNWDALSNKNTNSVRLCIDEDSDGISEHTVDLHTDMTGEDVETIIEEGEGGPEEGGIMGKISELPWLYILIPAIVLIIVAGAGLSIRRRRRKQKMAPPPLPPFQQTP